MIFQHPILKEVSSKAHSFRTSTELFKEEIYE
jgi:hypothetical protein